MKAAWEINLNPAQGKKKIEFKSYKEPNETSNTFYKKVFKPNFYGFL